MWAQLIKSRAKPGKEEDIRNLRQEMEAERGAMPIRDFFTCTNTKDPSEYYTFVVFESEEAARQAERSPEGGARAQRMAELFESREFVDLHVEYHRHQ